MKEDVVLAKAYLLMQLTRLQCNPEKQIFAFACSDTSLTHYVYFF